MGVYFRPSAIASKKIGGNDGDQASHACAIIESHLDELDVCSVPAGVLRRFVNLTHAADGKPGILMTVIAGNGPEAEFVE